MKLGSLLTKNVSLRYLLIISVVLFSSFALYVPFLTKTITYTDSNQSGGMHMIYQNYDGLYYLVPAMGWYNPKVIDSLRLEFALPLEYYAAHLPMYPFFIALFAPVVGSYLISMIGVNLLFTSFLAVFFYYFLKKLQLSLNPLILTIVFLFLPRFFVIRSVGAPESIFILFVLTSIYFFEKKRYVLSGLLGAFAVMTKVPGILLFIAYGFALIERFMKEKKYSLQALWLLLIPLGLMGVFSLYAIQYHNFFAFFNTGGVVPMPYPFSVFNSTAKWVKTVWLEDIVLYFFLYASAIISLSQTKYRSLFYLPLIFFSAGIFVQHRDLSRYLLPLWPFACIAFEKWFTSKKFVIVFILLFPAIYLYAVNFLQGNIIPVSDWRPFL